MTKNKFTSTSMVEFDIDLDRSPIDDVAGRNTEPLVDIGAALEAVADTLLEDDEESGEAEVLEVASTRPSRATVTSTRQSTG
ncbi:MAG TPA: hypothetical protein VGU68_08985, partial [Ktedonobacteraceae bacterium]|nr:hypothetical protein [Ktedonobacteraceae bacterium]